MNAVRNNRVPYIKSIRPLTKADLDHLRQKTRAPAIQTIRDAHHMIARLAAAGLPPGDIAFRTGYTRVRVTQLLNDPAMRNLVARYRSQIDERFLSTIDTFAEMAIGNMHKAERLLSDKLEDGDPDDFSVRELVAVTADRADRFGYQKRQTNVNVNVDFASKLEAAIARSRKQIEAE